MTVADRGNFKHRFGCLNTLLICVLISLLLFIYVIHAYTYCVSGPTHGLGFTIVLKGEGGGYE